MKRFVFYAFVAGIVGGFFIGKFSGSILKSEPSEKKDLSEKDIVFTTSPTVPSPESLPQTPASQLPTPDWHNVLLTLEDEYKKKDWKSFLQTLEKIQSDGKYPLPGIIGLLMNGFTQFAATSVQGMDNKNALFIAEGILKGTGSKSQKIEILKTIGEKGKDITPLLKWVLENEKDAQLLSLTLNAMGETKDPALIPFLSDYAQKHHELPLRFAAIEALENFNSNAIQSLEALLESGKLEEGKEQLALESAIIETLGNIGNSEAVSLLSTLARKREGSKSEGSYYALQQDAITALGDIGSTEALLSIGEIIADEGIDAQLRSFALNILTEVEKGESVPLLEDIINDRTIQELEIKKEAIDALGDIKGSEAVTFLAELITRPNNETPIPLQMEALSAMGRIGGSETVSTLETIINSEHVDMDVRKDAIFTLSKVGTETAVSVLERIVNDTSDPGFSRAALRGLQKIGNSDAISIIESVAQNHPLDDIRLIASKLLEASKRSR